MANSPRFPSPPEVYSRDWGNQYTRLLEEQISNMLGSIEGISARRQPASLAYYSRTVNFNSGNTDNAINIILPFGYSRYLVSSVTISGASGTLTTATAGVFTGAGATGVAVVTGASAITVSTASENTNNNTQSMSVNNAGTQSYNSSVLYFRVATPQGSAATANVGITIQLLL